MTQVSISREMFDKADDTRKYKYQSKKGLTLEVVKKISKDKNEPDWMLKKRIKALELFNKTPMPSWGPDLSNLDLHNITFYATPEAEQNRTKWEDVPEDIKNTFDRLGISKAEQEQLAGTGAQYDSLNVYHKLKKEWGDQGVIFEDMDVALHKYPDLVKEHFMTKCIPISDHKFIMLHAAVWSGGSFIYVPKGVKVTAPMQAYFRMNVKKGGQFEHTLIIIDEGAQAEYVEGCSAPQYGSSSLHAGCVELFVKKNARLRYSSVENWAKDTFNLNTKRAIVEEKGVIEWVGGNMGSGTTMLYPASILLGDNAKADHLGIAFASSGQNQDTGAKVVHIGKNTSSTIRSKSISKESGINSYRGLVNIKRGAIGAKVNVECDALLLNKNSVSNTYPTLKVEENDVSVGHEATVGKISKQDIYYLQSRGLTQEQALQMIVSGFIEPIVKSLPLEYAVELNKLIDMEMEGSIG